LPVSPAGESHRQAADLLESAAELAVKCSALHFGLGADLLRGLEGSGRGQHGQLLREQKVAPVAVRDLLHVAGAAKLVYISN
jgi:hypothetical protein